MKIAFTSCINYKHVNKQPYWNNISTENPDYLFLLGDNIYMDYGIDTFCVKKLSTQDFETRMKKKYEQQFKEPHFAALIKKYQANNSYFAIWDDHDFAWNNAHGTEINKGILKTSRKLFHTYHNCSTNYPETYYYVDTEMARIFFLDNRTYASKLELLGNKQFDYIQSNLSHSKKYTLFCGGITLTEGTENWMKYKSDLKKLCKIIQPLKNVFFLAGDIHKNKIIKPKEISSNLYTPVQLISSGFCIKTFIITGKQNNWATLELNEKFAKVSLFQYNKETMIQTFPFNS